MSMLDFFHLPHIIAVRSPQDVTLNSGVAWTEPVIYPCRIEPTSRLLRLADGQQVAASATVFVAQEGLPTDGLFFLRNDGADVTTGGQEPLAIQEHHDLLTGEYSHSQIWF